MRIRTMKDVSAAIRARRKTLGLGQAALAQKVGVSREWIIDIEKGKPRAEAALLLRTLYVLGLVIQLDAAGPATPRVHVRAQSRDVDIDGIINRALGRKR